MILNIINLKERLYQKIDMIQVYSSQFNYQYGNSIHFPYSIASLFAYIKSFPELDKQLQFEKTFIFRNKLDEYVDKIEDPDILLSQ